MSKLLLIVMTLLSFNLMAGTEIQNGEIGDDNRSAIYDTHNISLN